MPDLQLPINCVTKGAREAPRAGRWCGSAHERTRSQVINLCGRAPAAVGHFRELVEMAERNKPLRETLKQVLRLTKGWDVARDHVRRAVETDVQLRVYHPGARDWGRVPPGSLHVACSTPLRAAPPRQTVAPTWACASSAAPSTLWT